MHHTSPDEGRLIQEFATVLYEQDSAYAVALRAGLPKNALPEFKSAAQFWNSVMEGLRSSVTGPGVRALAAIAAEMYPNNGVFTGFADTERARISQAPGTPSRQNDTLLQLAPNTDESSGASHLENRNIPLFESAIDELSQHDLLMGEAERVVTELHQWSTDAAGHFARTIYESSDIHDLKRSIIGGRAEIFKIKTDNTLHSSVRQRILPSLINALNVAAVLGLAWFLVASLGAQ